ERPAITTCRKQKKTPRIAPRSLLLPDRCPQTGAVAISFRLSNRDVRAVEASDVIAIPNRRAIELHLIVDLRRDHPDKAAERARSLQRRIARGPLEFVARVHKRRTEEAGWQLLIEHR